MTSAAAMPRVLIVSGLYPTDENPADGIFVHEQAQALRRIGVDARVAAMKPLWFSLRRPRASLARLGPALRKADDLWSVRDGVPVLRLAHLGAVLVPASTYPLLRACVLRRVLPRLRSSFPYDLVHGHTAYWDGPAALAAARYADVPLVLTEHTGPLSSVLDRWLKRVQVKTVLARAEAVLAVSRALRDELVQRSLCEAEKVRVVPNGVDTAFFDPNLASHSLGTAPGATGFGEASPRALWIGHHVPVKRVDRLLKAFALAGKSVPNLRLTLVGEGPLEQSMRQLALGLGITDRVDFRPAANRDGIRDALAQSHFLVISSDVETFGVVGIEALAMGRPVVSTRCGGPADYLRSRLEGVLTAPTVEGLAAGLVELATNRHLADPGRLRAFATANYDFGTVASALRDVYTQVLDGAKPGRTGSS